MDMAEATERSGSAEDPPEVDVATTVPGDPPCADQTAALDDHAGASEADDAPGSAEPGSGLTKKKKKKKKPKKKAKASGAAKEEGRTSTEEEARIKVMKAAVGRIGVPMAPTTLVHARCLC